MLKSSCPEGDRSYNVPDRACSQKNWFAIFIVRDRAWFCSFLFCNSFYGMSGFILKQRHVLFETTQKCEFKSFFFLQNDIENCLHLCIIKCYYLLYIFCILSLNSKYFNNSFNPLILISVQNQHYLILTHNYNHISKRDTLNESSQADSFWKQLFQRFLLN